MFPTWSPNGDRIAFSSNRNYFKTDTKRWRKDIYIINSNGSELQRLTDNGNATRPVWGPNGRKLAFVWNIHGNNVFIYNFKKKKLTKLNSGLMFAGNPLWGNDNTRLLISGTQEGHSKSQIRLVSLKNDGTKVLQKVLLPQNLRLTEFDWYIQN